jgi:hypothetical protein
MVGLKDINIGDVVIVESIHYNKTGRRTDSEYYRTVAGEHPTVSGMAKHLTSEPDATFLNIPPWQMGWIYAGNDAYMQKFRNEGIYAMKVEMGQDFIYGAILCL